MIIVKCEQGSDEWFAARAGRATASEFSSVLAKGQGITRTKYLRRVVAERLTGKPVETYKNDHMERGSAQEAADASAKVIDDLQRQLTELSAVNHRLAANQIGLSVSARPAIPEDALRYAREFVADPDKRAQVKFDLANNGWPKLAAMIDEAVTVSRALLALDGAAKREGQ